MSVVRQTRARMRKVQFLVTEEQGERRARRAALKVARAERIRAMKERNPKPTWGEIGDYCGVSARAAEAWQEKGSIAVGNARRLAELWDVDFDWLYHGPEAGPEPHEHPEMDLRLTRIEQTLDRLEGYLKPPDAVRRLRGQLEARGTQTQEPNQEDGPANEPGTKR